MLTAAVMFLALGADPVPTITSPVGSGKKGFAGDGGLATKAELDQPFDVAFDRAGNIYFSDTNNHRVRRVDAKTGVITTVAGNGKKGFAGDGGKAVEASLNEPYGIELDDAGNLFVVDRLNYCVRMVDAKTAFISTIAGTGGKSGFAGDGGPANEAKLVEPNGICLGKGVLFVADVAGHRVRAVDLKSGTISTLIGNGKGVTAGDGGKLKDATTFGPRAVAMNPAKDVLYLVERNGHCIREIALDERTIARFAGTGKRGYSGDGGKAIEATFDGPKEIDVDRDGNLFIVDTENEAIRKIDAKSGLVTTVAGKGRTKTPGLGDNGPATAASLGRPHGVAVGPEGALYIGDTNSHRIRKVK